MADWDADSPRLRQNLTGVLRDVRGRALRREVPSVEDARRWHRDTMAGDARYPQGREVDKDGLAAVVDLCAWAHAEWVRIHPFANGNGRIARILANALLMRYGILAVIRLRPRPDGGYGRAADAALKGDWRPTAAAFRRMLGQPFT